MRNTRTITLYKGFTISINLYLAFLLDLVHGVSFRLRWRWAGRSSWHAGQPWQPSRSPRHSPNLSAPDRPRYACMLFTIAPVVNYIKRTHVMSNEN